MYKDSYEGGARARGSSFANHRTYYDEVKAFSLRSMSEGANPHLRWDVKKEAGDGFSEMLRLNSGLTVGLCGYRLKAPIENTYHESGELFTFSMLLSGYFEIAVEKNKKEIIRDGELWLSRRKANGIRCYQPANTFINGLSVEISAGMAEAWLGDYSCPQSQALEKFLKKTSRESILCEHGFFPRVRSLRQGHPLMQIARNLYATNRLTLCDKLHFEAIALDLLARILTIDDPFLAEPSTRPTTRRQKAVDEAVDILKEEWVNPPTIAILSRRIGINECYLKTDFRLRTGLSIGAYVRKLRMEKAFELIESGKCSILEAALFVGYSNPSHFSEAFKQFHGFLPSSCKPR